MTRPKDRGTAAESAVVAVLRAAGWPHAERRALSGGLDKGDTTGHPGFVVEVKACKILAIPRWLRETEVERINAGADFGILVYKPQGVGYPKAARWPAVMIQHRFHDLMQTALLCEGPVNSFTGEMWTPDFTWTTSRPRGIGKDDEDNFIVTLAFDDMLALLTAAGYGGARVHA